MAKWREWMGVIAAAVSLVAVALMTTTRKRKKPAATQPTASALESAGATDPNAPNVLLFVLDDLDVETLRRMVNANLLPNIKSRIIDGSVNFRNAFVPCSICSPSRASLLTGKFSHNHGVWHVVGDEGPQAFDAHLAATNNGYLPTWLDNAYYRAFVGKYHLGSRHPNWDFYRPVDGYDPRPGMYRATENGVFVWPNVYQTKYIGDSAKEAIAAAGDRRFFLLVAPTPIHVNISGWHQRTAQARAPFTGTPVAFAQFPNTPTGGWRQHLVTVDFSSGGPVYLWWSRDSQQRDSGWGDWTNTGNAATIAPNTGNGAVVGWNVLLPSPGVRRQQLLRQTGTRVEFYSRDLSDTEPAKPWALVADETTLAGTGTLPVAGWSAVIFPSGLIRQQVVRGSETLGYVSYMRHRPAGGTFTPWRLDPDWGEMVVFGRLCGFSIVPTEGARYVVKLILRRPGATAFEWWQSAELVDFHELAVTGSVEGGLERVRDERIPDEGDLYRDPAMEYSPTGQVYRDKETSGQGPEAIGPTTIVTEVHPYFLLRAYAEGGWSPVVPGQTYEYGGSYPAGSLRAGRDPNGFAPSSPTFDLPRSKASFNRQIDNRVPFFSPAAWPDLNNPVPGGRRQQDYLTRLHLDRMEQLISIDRMVGEVVSAAGSNTLIIFTSDNGHFQGEHRLSNKLTSQEESVRVPLYVRGPNAAAREVTELVANIDIAPTLLDYAGRSWQNPVFNVDGRSLRNLIEGRTVRSWRRSLLLEFHRPRGLSEPDRSATDWRFGLPDYLGLRQLHTTSGQVVNEVYVEYYVDIADPSSITDYELYRLTGDPHQVDNLATAPVPELSRILQAFYASSGEGSRVQDMEGLPPIAV